jgi:DNA processing protein
LDTATTARYLTLVHHPHFGGGLLGSLLSALGSVQQIRTADTEALAALGVEPPQLAVLQTLDYAPDGQVAADLQWSTQGNNGIITFEDPAYPVLLKLISRPPPLLYIRGNPAVLRLPQLAVVGSRGASAAGLHHGLWLASELARRGLCICSGMARGIDTQAHRGALSVNAPTVAVLGTGVDVVYPPSNRQLAQAILEQGVLVSEFPLGAPPLAAHFPQRNRIISGMSLGVLVVEATTGSGSLITARHGLEQNREVFALPGAIGNPQARGCHELIRQGAKLVDSVECILEELGPLVQLQRSTLKQASLDPAGEGTVTDESVLSKLARRVLHTLGFDERSLDALVQDSGLDLPAVSSSLVELELRGIVEPCGGRFRRTH